MTLTEAMNVRDGTITSSPGPTSHACNTRKAPVVQLDTPTACSAPHSRAKRRSNSAKRGPPTTQPLRTTAAAASASASPKQGRLKEMASFTHSTPCRQRFVAVPGEAPIAYVVFQKIGWVRIVDAKPVYVAAQPLVEIDLSHEGKRVARKARLRPQGSDVAGPRLDEPRGNIGSSAEVSYCFGQLPHSHHLAIGYIDHAAYERIGVCGEGNAPCGFCHIGEVAAVFARSEDHRRQPVQHARNKTRDHFGRFPRHMLPRTVGVKRSDDGCRQTVSLPIGQGVVLAGELGGTVNGNWFADCGLFVEAPAPRIAVNFGRGAVDETPDPAAPGDFQNV